MVPRALAVVLWLAGILTDRGFARPVGLYRTRDGRQGRRAGRRGQDQRRGQQGALQRGGRVVGLVGGRVGVLELGWGEASAGSVGAGVGV